MLTLLRNLKAKLKYGSKSTQEIFTDIYNKKGWGDGESASGTGSDLTQTQEIIKQLPVFLKELKITTMLDIPCGDFHWMSQLDLSAIQYTGGDIVEKIIEDNEQKYGNENCQFIQQDLLDDFIPEVDLIFCRDCLVHLSFSDIKKALKNIQQSKSTYLLTSTFVERGSNQDIQTGQWRPLNFQKAPFNFPAPLKIIVENNTEDGGVHKDKALGLWKINAL